MAIQKLTLVDLQFRDENDREKSRRLAEDVRRLQQALNRVIEELNSALIKRDSAGTLTDLAPGAWAASVVAGSPPTFTIRYNDGGTIKTGTITLT